MHATHTRETGLCFLLLGLLLHLSLKKLPAKPWCRRPALICRDFFLYSGAYLMLDAVFMG
ncbi:MAG TPA: hypothetical protein VL547_08760 [Dinghuibacter sp.]|jgi:hypothetical protein|uniref:hypothetical protein n=1 Tax=Dinghuibacter sp. TaxID=2024697 RepID=UPI002C705D86|nr:hypothetical protein [Dinghuibacter sp.]HTJ12103.1 hypothetical protein [Dinghuibacter sp.]